MTRPIIEFHDKGECTCEKRLGWRHYTIDGTVVPSVSQIVGVIDKSGPLQWYAARITREGIIRLLADGVKIPRDEKKLHYVMKDRGLTYQQATSDAAERGTGLHTIQEEWVQERKVPNPSEHPASWRPYITAYARFLMDYEPEFEGCEQVVGSATHGFAGRRDLTLRCRGTKQGKSGLGLWDLKSGKGIYPTSHFVQIEGYDLGGIEVGEDATDYRAIVQIGPDGEYSVGYSTATHDDFLAYLAAFNAVRGVESRAKAAK